jgi:hypothetical protein
MISCIEKISMVGTYQERINLLADLLIGIVDEKVTLEDGQSCLTRDAIDRSRESIMALAKRARSVLFPDYRTTVPCLISRSRAKWQHRSIMRHVLRLARHPYRTVNTNDPPAVAYTLAHNLQSAEQENRVASQQQ